MSSTFVRTSIKAFLTTNFPAESQVDVSAEPTDLSKLLQEAGINMSKFDPWLALQFIGSDEIPITVPATNTQGKQRETGAIALHAVEKSGLGVVDKIQPRLEALRNKFRNERIADKILILSVAPPNYSTGATLDLQGGYTSGTILLSYEYTFSLPV